MRKCPNKCSLNVVISYITLHYHLNISIIIYSMELLITSGLEFCDKETITFVWKRILRFSTRHTRGSATNSYPQWQINPPHNNLCIFYQLWIDGNTSSIIEIVLKKNQNWDWVVSLYPPHLPLSWILHTNIRHLRFEIFFCWLFTGRQIYREKYFDWKWKNNWSICLENRFQSNRN